MTSRRDLTTKPGPHVSPSGETTTVTKVSARRPKPPPPVNRAPVIVQKAKNDKSTAPFDGSFYGGGIDHPSTGHANGWGGAGISFDHGPDAFPPGCDSGDHYGGDNCGDMGGDGGDGGGDGGGGDGGGGDGGCDGGDGGDGGGDGGDGGGDGCFSGDSLVQMSDQSLKPVGELKKGDQVVCDATESTAEVVCVVAMRVSSPRIRMFQLTYGLQITARHPILLPGTRDWVSPQHLPLFVARAVNLNCSHVYNVILSAGSSTMLINGVTCLTLGHGFQGELEHEFWGNRERVVGSLLAIDANGFERGWIEVGGTLRDGLSGRVCRYKSVESKAGVNLAGGPNTRVYTAIRA